MTILWINLTIVFIFSLFSRYFSVPSISSNITEYQKPNKFFVFIVITCLVSVSGLRSNIGDTYVYKDIYENNDFTWDYIFSQKDVGFGVLQKILKLFSDDPQLMLFTTALITNLLIILVFYNYSRLFELSTFIYITGGTHLVSMNGIRQVLAAAICFAAIKFLMNRNFVKYALVIILASTIHFSALIMLPVYFLVHFKAWSKYTFLMVASSVAIVFSFETFTSILFSALEDTQYSEYSTFDEGGANVIRVAVSAAPLFLAFIGREKLRQVFPKIDYIVNMSILGLLFMIISTQSWIFARVSIYFNLYQLILVSWVLEAFTKKDQRFLYYCIIIFYFAYYYYENVISLGINYRSPILESLF